MDLFPLPLCVSGSSVLIHQQREFSGKRGRVQEPLWGLAFGELWLNYLERKTEVEEVVMCCGHGRGPPSPSWCTYSDGDQLCFNRLILWI